MRSNGIIQEGPHFQVLSPEQVRDIHHATLEVLEITGTEVYDDEALDLLRKGGAKVDGTRVRFPAGLVEWAIEAAPSRIALYDREGSPALDLSGYNVYFGPGPSCPNILDVDTGERRPVRKQDVMDYARLCDHLSHIDFVMSMGLISDCPTEVSDVEEFAAMVRNTPKPIVAWSWNEDGARDILDMALAFRGDVEELRLSPFYLLYAEPTAPLRHTRDAVKKLLFMAERGLPVVYGAGPVGGASSPLTIAGMIVTGSAEVLSGLVMAQLKREGAPFVYGSGTGPMDMSTMMVAYGAPEFMLGQAGICQMARFYGLPSWGFGGCGEAKVPDQQAALQSALWNTMAGLMGANLVHDVGYLESAMTGSMEMLVINNEVIGMVKRLLEGIRVSPEELALDTIHQVGPGGHFLEQGRKTMGDRAREQVKEIMAQYRPQPVDREGYLDSILSRARKRIATNTN